MHCTNLRAAALTNSKMKPEQFAVLVRDIPPMPKGQTRNEQVDSFFRKLHPETFYKSMVITDIKQVLIQRNPNTYGYAVAIGFIMLMPVHTNTR